MPRFYFDLQNGDGPTPDTEGQELPSRDHARREAIETLPEIARDEIRKGDPRDVTIIVRDDSDKPIFEARLSLSTRWLD